MWASAWAQSDGIRPIAALLTQALLPWLAPALGGNAASQCAVPMIRRTLDSEKYSAGDVTPELTRAKPSMASWLP